MNDVSYSCGLIPCSNQIGMSFDGIVRSSDHHAAEPPYQVSYTPFRRQGAVSICLSDPHSIR